MSQSDGMAVSTIEQARRLIADDVWITPVADSPALSARLGVPVHLKLEHLQCTGSFKLRGASHALRLLDKEALRLGVIGVSTGNHGRALAFAARRMGVRCVICMSELVPEHKVAAIRALGAEVRTVGRSQDEAQLEVERLISEQGMTLLPPFDHADIIAGQGTLGLELIEQLPTVESVVLPVSGGGLFSGVAAAIRSRRPSVRMVGVSMRRGAAMHASLEAGRPVPVDELPTLADALSGGIGLDNRFTFRMVRALIDDFILVEEHEIAAAIRHAYRVERQILEGSGAVGVAAVLAGKYRSGGPVAIVCSGGNIDMALHWRIVSGQDVNLMQENGEHG